MTAPALQGARRGISPQAFFTLLLLACLFGGNHVAARFAFDHGTDVATAVAVRSLVTAAVVAALVLAAGLRVRPTPRQWRSLALIAALVAVQSVSLYSAVARIPVALSLLAFNTYPLWGAFWAWAVYRHRPERRVLLAMPVILVGLSLALDVTGAASGLGAQAHWARMGLGVALALVGGACFGLVLALTQHEVAMLDGRFRTMVVMGSVGVLAGVGALALGGPHWPQAQAGWWGLAGLTALYGTAFTATFIVLPKLGAVGNSPILNVEPIFALLMAWAWLGQAIAAVQIGGALLVVGTVMALGLRRRGPA